VEKPSRMKIRGPGHSTRAKKVGLKPGELRSAEHKKKKIAAGYF